MIDDSYNDNLVSMNGGQIVEQPQKIQYLRRQNQILKSQVRQLKSIMNQCSCFHKNDGTSSSKEENSQLRDELRSINAQFLIFKEVSLQNSQNLHSQIETLHHQINRLHNQLAIMQKRLQEAKLVGQTQQDKALVLEKDQLLLWEIVQSFIQKQLLDIDHKKIEVQEYCEGPDHEESTWNLVPQEKVTKSMHFQTKLREIPILKFTKIKEIQKKIMEKKKDPGKKALPPTIQNLQKSLQSVRLAYIKAIAQNSYLRKQVIRQYRQIMEIETRNLLLLGLHTAL